MITSSDEMDAYLETDEERERRITDETWEALRETQQTLERLAGLPLCLRQAD